MLCISGTVKVRQDVTFHDIPPITTSPPIPKLYMPLWDAIDFLDRITVSDDMNVYMHAWPTTLSMPLIYELSHSHEKLDPK